MDPNQGHNALLSHGRLIGTNIATDKGAEDEARMWQQTWFIMWQQTWFMTLVKHRRRQRRPEEALHTPPVLFNKQHVGLPVHSHNALPRPSLYRLHLPALL